MAVSPDGEYVAFVTGGNSRGSEQLHLRALNQLTSEILVSESGIFNPFFSPDSQQLGYYLNRSPVTLNRVAVQGGPSSTIVELPSGMRGASWGDDDTIVFSANDGLWRVAAAGGIAEQLTTPDTAEGERAHRWPEVLPGGEAVLFTIWKNPVEDSQIAALSLDTGERTIIVRGSDPRYAPTGHVVYGADGSLWAVPFDLDRLQAVGDAVPVVEGVLTKTSGTASFDLTGDGSLVYVAGRGPDATDGSTLVWVERNGQEIPVPLPPRGYNDLSLSPDGTRAAFVVDDGGNQDVWVAELDRGTLARITSDPALDVAPRWSPDGRRIAFASRGTGSWEVVLRAPDGTGDATVVATFDDDVQRVVPWGWSPDGTKLTVMVDDATSRDIGTIPSDGSGTWEPLIHTDANEEMPAIAPNGQWIAYVSDETGDLEVYLQRYPDLGDRRLVSVGGDVQPIWSLDGRELLYGRGGPPDAMMRVTIDMAGDDPSATVGTPELLFDYRYRANRFSQNHALSPDGERLLMIKRSTLSDGDLPAQIILVQNWFQELTERVPTN